MVNKKRMKECNKKGHDSKELAEESCRYAISKGWIENANYSSYECGVCYKWHFGHTSNYNVGQRMKNSHNHRGKKKSTLL